MSVVPPGGHGTTMRMGFRRVILRMHSTSASKVNREERKAQHRDPIDVDDWEKSTR
jgi:hypothetical protein